MDAEIAVLDSKPVQAANLPVFKNYVTPRGYNNV